MNNIEDQFKLSDYSTFEVNNEETISPSNNTNIYKFFFFVLLALSFLFSFNNTKFYDLFNDTNYYRNKNKYTSYNIEVTSKNPGYDTINSLSLLPWDVVIEPSRPQYISISYFSINDNEKDLSANDYIIKWFINDEIYDGNDLEIQLDQTGVYDCVVSIIPKSSVKIRRNPNSLTTNKRKLRNDFFMDQIDEISDSYQLYFTLAVKYVRREIRTLTSDDINNFFTALHTTYTLNEVEGQKIYGNKYHSAEYFLKKHLNGAGRSDCDYWHDGAGIVTHHMAFTLEFEQALQAINPSISVPYWEYGMDLYIYDNWFESPIFDSDWFGEASPKSADHSIADGGFWQGIAFPDGKQYKDWSMSETSSLNPFVNAYGVLRTPWNNNPSNYIGRSNQTYSEYGDSSMPSCRQLLDCFESDSTASMNQCINGNTHGPVHILIGGAWGEGNTLDDEDISFLRSHFKPAGFKNLWRMGFTRCPSSCKSGETCLCRVPDEYIETYGAKAIIEAALLNDTVSSFGSSDEIYLKALRGLEDAAYVGDMFTSSAPFDPTFWSVHGASERLLDYKRILVSQGDVTGFDETWAYDRGDGRAVYLYGVCDWSNVKDSNDLTLPTCNMEQICSGHFVDDIIEFGDFLGKGETYSNQEFYDFIHPWNDDLPYTYDTFDYDYCANVGLSFTDYTSSYKGYKVNFA